MRSAKRVVRARRNYVLEQVERRWLMSISPIAQAAIDAIPADLKAHLYYTPSEPTNYAGYSAPLPNTITVAEMRTAYGITGTGAGQTIAIIDALDWPTAERDLATFDAYYGLPAPPSFLKLNQVGGTANAARPGDGGNPQLAMQYSGETALDVEWAHAMAPEANILLVEADSLTTRDLFTAIAFAAQYPGVSTVSMSFGQGEFAQQLQADALFSTPVGHQGVTFIASSGDLGAFTTGVAGDYEVSYPASSPNVVSVGGTNLTTGPGGTYGFESAWGSGQRSYTPFDANGNSLGGSGGGISLYETAPDYQRFVTGDVGGGFRTVPDIALQGGPDRGVSTVNSYATGDPNNPWDGPVYGTSLSAPLFAGILAGVDTIRVNTGLDTLDGTTQTLPHLYELPSNAFHDVTNGDNGYPAGIGYDLVTGRGSPLGTNFVPDLASTYIGYHVFADVNVNGVQDPGETGVAGAGVTLTTAGTGQLVASTVTDANGFYQFLNPAAGNYTVTFSLPGGFQVSPLGNNADRLLNNVVVASAVPSVGTAAVTVSSGADVRGIRDVGTINCGAFTETVSIGDATVNRPTTGTTTLTFTVTLGVTAISSYTVPFTTVDGTAADTGTYTGPATAAHGDYQATTGTLTFAPGSRTATVAVVILGNAAIEKDLIFTVQLTPPPGEFDLGSSDTTGTGTIVNTVFPFAVVNNSAAVTRSATASEVVAFPVTLSAPAPFPVTVDYRTADYTAVNSVDYVRASGTVMFGIDDTTGLTASLTQNVPISILPGTNRQLDKTFTLNLTTSDHATVTTPASASATILTNAPPAVTATGGVVTESLTGVALLPFQINVEPSLTGPVTVSYSTVDGTARAGTDYAATAGTVTLSPGKITQTVYVPVYRQFLEANDKTLSFVLSNPVGQVLLENATVTGTIHYLPVTTVPVSRTQRAVYTDNLGQRVTINMTGPGSGTIVFLGTNATATNAYSLSLTGTTAATNLTVSVAGPGGQTTVQDIDSDGSLNVLSARGLNVAGPVTFAGTVNSLTLGYLQGSTVTLGGTAASRGVAITLNRAVDATINSGQPIRSLVAGSYINTTPAAPDYITAPSVGRIRVAGNFGGVVRTPGMVQAVMVKGALVGGIQADGGIGSVTAGSLDGATLAATTGDTTALTAASFATKAGIGRVQVMSDFSNSVIAGYSVGKVTLGSVDTTSSSATPFGVFGRTIAGVQTSLDNSSDVVALVKPRAKTSYGDFTVDLV